MGGLWHLALTLAVVALPAQPSEDPHEILQEAERLAWLRANLEGSGVRPDVEEPLQAEALWSGVDTQLARALACLGASAPPASTPA